MKISIFKPIAALLATALMVQPVQARPNLETMIDSRELYEVEATAYCNPNGNLTYTGRRTVDDLTIATCKEWLGCTIYVWEITSDGTYEYLGIYEATDTGGDKRIQSGQCVDIFMSDRTDCINFGRKKVAIQIVRGVG